MAATSSGPNARAGFSEAPVTGPATMMIAITTAPMTIPPEIARRTRVHDAQDREHQDRGANRLGRDRRRPGGGILVERGLADAEVDRRVRRAPRFRAHRSLRRPPERPNTQAPPSKAQRFVRARAKVTAGLMWQPETLPI